MTRKNGRAAARTHTPPPISSVFLSLSNSTQKLGVTKYVANLPTRRQTAQKKSMFTPSSKPQGKRVSPDGNGSQDTEEIVLERRGFKHVEICNPSPAVLAAVQHVGENDPAICLDWNFVNLSAAVDWANIPANRPPIPPWYPGPGGAAAYPINVVGIQQGLSTLLAQCGSGHQNGTVLLAPNTLEQFARIRDKIRDLMLVDPFLLAICAGNRCPLARVFVIADGKQKTTGEHMAMQPLPAGYGVDVFE
jgi:hypothetical protein